MKCHWNYGKIYILKSSSKQKIKQTINNKNNQTILHTWIDEVTILLAVGVAFKGVKNPPNEGVMTGVDILGWTKMNNVI